MKKLGYYIIIITVFCFSSIFAQAEEAVYSDGFFHYHLREGYISICEYFGNQKEVEIPSSIAGKPVSVIESSTFSTSHNVEVIYLPDTIVSIEKDVFRNINSLKKIVSDTVGVDIPVGEAVQVVYKREENAAEKDDAESDTGSIESPKEEEPKEDNTESPKEDEPKEDSTESPKEDEPKEDNTESPKEDEPKADNTESSKEEEPEADSEDKKEDVLLGAGEYTEDVDMEEWKDTVSTEKNPKEEQDKTSTATKIDIEQEKNLTEKNEEEEQDKSLTEKDTGEEQDKSLTEKDTEEQDKSVTEKDIEEQDKNLNETIDNEKEESVGILVPNSNVIISVNDKNQLVARNEETKEETILDASSVYTMVEKEDKTVEIVNQDGEKVEVEDDGSVVLGEGKTVFSFQADKLQEKDSTKEDGKSNLKQDVICICVCLLCAIGILSYAKKKKICQ